MEEEDTFLVIVGDSEDESKFEPSDTIETKPMVKLELETLVDIVETTEIEEQGIEIKLEPEYVDYEYLEDEAIQIENLPENFLKSKSPEFFSSDNEEYIPEGYIACSKSVNSTITKTRKRWKMLELKDQKSFVADLREKYPELAQDKDLLIQTLCEIMRNVKAPSSPHGSYFMKDASYECAHCGAFTETVPAAERHYAEKHGPRYLVCYACGVDFRSTTNLYKHEKRCTARDARIVLRARARRVGTKGRGRPRERRPPLHAALPAKHKVRYSCTQCTASFVTMMALESHQNLHNGVKPYKCHTCPAAYTSLSVLLRHEKKHSMAQYICDHCSRAFTVKAALVAHMDTHLPFRKYGCAECERRFAQKSALQLHVNRVHRHLPMPFACDVCDKRCARMSLLKQHMQTQHGLLIMTRKMFFRKLPNMSEEELKKAVKVVFKTNAQNDNDDPADGNRIIINERADVQIVARETIKKNIKKKKKKVGRKKKETDAGKNNMHEILPESSTMAEFIKYLKLEGKISEQCANVLVIENGQILDSKGTEEEIRRMLLTEEGDGH